MPDSFRLPSEGAQSHDDRALDSLLSGDTADVAAPLRPVADTLNALRAAPSARELRGEAAARAQFRALRADALADAGASRTLEMPAVPTQRHRGTPVRAARRRSFRVRLAGLASAAAVVVLAAAVTYTGNLPGRLQRIAHDTIAAPPGRTAPGPARGGVQTASASPVAPSAAAPSVSGPASGAPSPSSAGAQGKTALCDQFWSDLEHSRPGGMSWQTPRYSQLVVAAGGARNVFGYCYPVWDPEFAPHYQQLPSYPPYFPKKWGSAGARGKSQGQTQVQPQSPGSRQEPAPGQGRQTSPSPSASGGPQPESSGGSPSSETQDQGSSSRRG